MARVIVVPGVDQDLERYGRQLAADIDHESTSVDVLIGLSVGTQAATVAASLTSLVKQLVLVSPTIDPAYRSMIKQATVFVVRGDPHDKAAIFSQVPDWSRAGIRRIFRGFASALALPIEDVLPRMRAQVRSSTPSMTCSPPTRTRWRQRCWTAIPMSYCTTCTISCRTS